MSHVCWSWIFRYSVCKIRVKGCHDTHQQTIEEHSFEGLLIKLHPAHLERHACRMTVFRRDGTGYPKRTVLGRLAHACDPTGIPGHRLHRHCLRRPVRVWPAAMRFVRARPPGRMLHPKTLGSVGREFQFRQQSGALHTLRLLSGHRLSFVSPYI